MTFSDTINYKIELGLYYTITLVFRSEATLQFEMYVKLFNV